MALCLSSLLVISVPWNDYSVFKKTKTINVSNEKSIPSKEILSTVILSIETWNLYNVQVPVLDIPIKKNSSFGNEWFHNLNIIFIIAVAYVNLTRLFALFNDNN